MFVLETSCDRTLAVAVHVYGIKAADTVHKSAVPFILATNSLLKM